MNSRLSILMHIGPFLICGLFWSSSSFCDEFLFPDTLQKPASSNLFEKVLSNPADIKARKLLTEHYTVNALPIEAAVFRRSLKEVMGSSDACISGNSSETPELRFSIFCSLYNGLTREETRQLQDATRNSAELLAKESPQVPCEVRKKAEVEIANIAFGCPLVAEWAYATFLCATIHGNDASYSYLELSFRSLVELEGRGILPFSTPTSTDLYFFLSRAFSQLGDVPTATVLAEISIEKYPKKDEKSTFQTLSPSIPKADIEGYIKKLKFK